MEVIQTIAEDTTLSTAEKVLFAILYCRKEKDECHLSVSELVQYVGVEVETLLDSLQNLEQAGLIKIRDDCEITDASSFLSCTVLREKLNPDEPDVPRP
jgi:DNA-binding MarR family transcriptional regulator